MLQLFICYYCIPLNIFLFVFNLPNYIGECVLIVIEFSFIFYLNYIVPT